MSLPVSRTGHGPEVTTDALRKGDAIICAACPPLMTDARPDARWSLSQFKIGRELGSGFASVVYQAQCRLTSHPCVIKVYKKARSGPQARPSSCDLPTPASGRAPAPIATLAGNGCAMVR